MRVKCDRYKCDWIGEDTEMLTAPHPFQDGEIINGCPGCKEVDTIVRVCDEPGCNQAATCGTPTESGYRQTCGKHMPERE